MRGIAIAFALGALLGAGVATCCAYAEVIRQWLRRGGGLSGGR